MDAKLPTSSTDTTERSDESLRPRSVTNPTLPVNLSVLFVDDDSILRKLFSRAVKRAAPTWTVSEAACGEKALKLVETQHFDVIFMDQYMATEGKQMLGTETVACLREKSVESTICGLSANSLEEDFINAGHGLCHQSTG